MFFLLQKLVEIDSQCWAPGAFVSATTLIASPITYHNVIQSGEWKGELTSLKTSGVTVTFLSVILVSKEHHNKLEYLLFKFVLS